MTVGKALGRKRNLVYSTREDRDDNLNVFKRRRAALFQETSTEEDQVPGDEVSGRGQRSAKLRALKAIEAGEESDSSSDTENRKSSEPLVNLTQSIIDPADIEVVKKQNSKGLRSIGDILEKCESSVDNGHMSLSGHGAQLAADPQGQAARKTELRLKYQQKHALPPILYRADLISKIQPFLQLVQDLFENRVSSYYKHEATNASRASSSAFLSLEEFRSMDINRFLAGYYGLKRQLSVGEEILRQFRTFLLKRQGNTMRWWGVADFANYVLAPEVLASLCIQEMGLGEDVYDRETREKAYDIFNSTTEFGLAIADAEPLELWEAQSTQQPPGSGINPN